MPTLQSGHFRMFVDALFETLHPQTPVADHVIRDVKDPINLGTPRCS